MTWTALVKFGISVPSLRRRSQVNSIAATGCETFFFFTSTLVTIHFRKDCRRSTRPGQRADGDGHFDSQAGWFGLFGRSMACL